ncbi:hypothetical protein FQZ97_1107770 [compost metagenome]
MQAAQGVQRLQHRGVGQVHHRLAAGLLVAAGHQRVECERVTVGHGACLLHEGAQHARLSGRERALLKIVAARAAG